MCEDRDLPWLQDDEDTDVWGTWEVEFRDVQILGRDNVHVETYNLSEHDLSEEEEYEGLKALLIEVAER